jgi:hypothetical protein
VTVALIVGTAVFAAMSVRHPTIAFVFILYSFALEQLLLAYIPALRDSATGLMALNLIVGLVTVLCLVRQVLLWPGFLSGSVTTSLGATIALFCWAAVTCIWSPSENAIPAVLAGLPYLLLMVGLAPMLLRTPEDVQRAMVNSLLIGAGISFAVLASDQFSSKSGRLGVEISGTVRTNPLALGEFGASLLLTAALFRSSRASLLMLRITCILLGLAVALRSGSRGQFVSSVVIAMLFTPAVAPVRNVKSFLAGVALIGTLGLAAVLLQTLLLEGFDAKRFSIEELLYGQSSASGRLANIRVLFEAWIQSPTSMLIGLGYYAFNSLAGSRTEPYSHVLFADAIFELGIPGTVLMGAFVWIGLANSLHGIRDHLRNPNGRMAFGYLAACIAFQLLLANKQGALWGIPYLFMYGCVLARVLRVSQSHPDVELDRLSGIPEQSDESAVTLPSKV